jgi:hypothetical protein
MLGIQYTLLALASAGARILAKPLCGNHSVGYGTTPSHTLNYILAHKLEEALE